MDALVSLTVAVTAYGLVGSASSLLQARQVLRSGLRRDHPRDDRTRLADTVAAFVAKTAAAGRPIPPATAVCR